jgi:transcriptional regulator with XRE-family HTH domain
MPHRLMQLMDHRRLPGARERVRLSVHEAAEQAGISPGVLSAWEQGRGRPCLDELRRLAALYASPIGIFFVPGPAAEAEAPDDASTPRFAAQRH